MPSSNTLFLLLSAIVFILSSQVSPLHAKEETNNVEEPKSNRGVYKLPSSGPSQPSGCVGLYCRGGGPSLPRGRGYGGPSPPSVYYGGGGYGSKCRYGCCHYASGDPGHAGCTRCCANAHEAHNVKH